MRVTIGYLDEFKRGAKALPKKYPSFDSDTSSNSWNRQGLTDVFIAGVIS